MNVNMRGNILQDGVLQRIIDKCILTCDEIESDTERKKDLYQTLIIVICNTLAQPSQAKNATTKCWIPGQTAQINKVKKISMQQGSLIGLYYIINNTKLKNIQNLIKELVLSTLVLADI